MKRLNPCLFSQILASLLGGLLLVGSASAQITPYPTNSLMLLPPVQAYATPAYAASGYPLPRAPSMATPARPYGNTHQIWNNQHSPSNISYDTPAGGWAAPPIPSPDASAWSDSSDDCDSCGPALSAPCRSPWYARANGLIMTRDTENAEWFSFYTDIESIQLMDSRDLVAWGGGVETLIGYNFCGFATEVSYWGLYTGTAEANLFDVAGAALNTTLSINGAVQYNPGGGNVSITSLFDGAQRHRLRRDYEMHNIEWNFLSGLGSQSGGCPAGGSGGYYQPLFGFRLMRFTDEFGFYADTINTAFTGDPNEVNYSVKTENNLIGCQLGGRGQYWINSRLRLSTTAKFGAFLNYANQSSFLGGSNGPAVITAGPNTGLIWDVNSRTSDLAFIGELDFGLNYQLTRRWSASLGYRVMALSGVALSTNQIPRDFRGIQDVEAIDINASLILHGGYAGLEFLY